MKTLAAVHADLCSKVVCGGKCDFLQAIDRAIAIRDEAMKEWKSWAADKGCDLEEDPGPDGRKYRKLKAETL